MKISSLFTIEDHVLKEYNGGGRVVVPDGVQVIGKKAFGGCRNLTSVVLPDSVTRIEEGAFAHCYRLTEVRLPDGLTSIGRSAFDSCEKLVLTALPETVTEIGAWAFVNCYHVSLDHIPDRVTTIGDGAFHRCRQMQDADGFIIVRNVLYSYRGKAARLVIPGHVTVLGSQSIERHMELTEVVLPEGLTHIGDSAFDQCARLQHIILPDGVTEIGERAFADCTSLETVRFPAALRRIGRAAFSACTALQEVMLPDGAETIGWEAFAGCTSLTKVLLPDSVTEMEDAAFAHCSKLHQLRTPAHAALPANLATNANHPFYGCYKLMDPSGFLILRGVLYRYGGNALHIEVPPQVTAIADSAFAYCSFLESVTLPDGLIHIGEEAFRGCFGLRALTIPAAVTSIGRAAFAGCHPLTVSFNGTVPAPTDPSAGAFANAFADVDTVIAPHVPLSYFAAGEEQRAAVRGFLRSWSLYECTPARPAYVRYALQQRKKFLPMVFRADIVPALAFYADNGAVTDDHFDSDYLSMSIAAGATGCTAFLLDWRSHHLPVPDMDAQLEQVWSAPEAPPVRETDWKYRELPDGTLEIAGYFGSDIDIIVPERIGNRFVTEIGDHTFNAKGQKAQWRQEIRSVYLPDGISRIGAWAFYECAGLTQVRLPDSLLEIGRRAFEGCVGLTEVHLPDGLEYVDRSLFHDCTALQTVTLPDSLTTLSDRMFSGCIALTEIVLSDCVQHIGANTFAQCGELTICAPAGSMAEHYAAAHHIAFRVR